ncbi:ribonuclease Y [Candidatus Azambacteria bacterium RIFOXYC1_FULL_41_20]|nr:MAG: Ribonuclease Y [Candidatus Azambacteria bacterium GW2011_GWA2_42_62]OGD40932.1 MAG: ribonuclease Y [Candidatus Azambacteria bacterium RIFCSPLOWO2_02_FULL_42_10]OGD41359.1 MAG: ribonuclease Y [Candidatus Azambacteria bacterium RIFOXYB1_FULL_40_33]OGD42730.1 MAG: ribonuclease Y [Candidatus Azambacteria bacterium RIFOXYA1_FULL_42_37]OGD43842.1 MAG: ribonuclease Y [Candidatus Azambacteria bacterium RIFOXYC1_FULL_41_20]OGD47635.1 MAG: ribonuclease Y [Candidatus Azambacteria bacterium RIFOXY
MTFDISIGALILAGGVALGYLIRQLLATRNLNSIEATIKRQLEESKTQAKEALLEAKDKAVKILEDAKNQERERLAILSRQEDRLNVQLKKIEQKEDALENGKQFLEKQAEQIKAIHQEADALKKKSEEIIEQVSGLSREEAKAKLLSQIEEDSKADLIAAMQKMEKNRLEELEKKARSIMTTAIQRYARSHISEITTSTVSLPSDELKGRIIGKEGRNIRALERLTGVEIIVDETPEAITLSSFDPLRREIAKTALLKLMSDGRIQPARIEEKVEEAKKEVSKKVMEAGEMALYEVGILDIPKEVTMLLGRLAFRTSYGQNVLLHSIEMAHIAKMLAKELGANTDVAKKAALLHDIGKAVDHEIEGTHLELGRKILQKYGIDQAVIQAMESHHEDYPFSSSESFIVAAADIISGARPGARRDSVENYIKRLTELENIANSFAGVEKSYAIAAGREIRIFVHPEKIDDLKAIQLAKEMAKRIESELKYPGEIKVNIIRETRAVEYAR